MEEVWKDIIGYEEYYQVSNKGNVRSKDRWYDAPYLKNKQVIFRKGVSIKPRPNKYGYLTVCLKKNSKGKTIPIHKLVAAAFIENVLRKTCIDHINGNRTDNRVENLRWVTIKENQNNPITKKRLSECKININWFKLTDEEQALYDAIAIMIKKEHLPMAFPVEMMYKHIKDRESYEKLKTPFTFNYGYISLKMSEKDNPIFNSIEKYITHKIRRNSTQEYSSFESLSGDLTGLSHSMNKEIERARLNGESDEEIYGTWGSMNDYKDL